MAKKVKVPLKNFATNEEFHKFVENEKEWMYNRIVNAIEQAYNDNKLEAVIFEAKIQESMSIIVMNSELGDWENSLKLAIKWYETLENYEKCSSISKLIENINKIGA